MLIKTFGCACYGISATVITMETDASPGLGFCMVGLPDSAVKESQHRISTALERTGFRMPGRKVVINMAPADIRKEGAAYDLPLAIGLLAASGQMKHESVGRYIIMGELSLDGNLRPITGVLPIALQALAEQFEGFILPLDNAREAAVVKGLNVYGARDLKEVVHFFEDPSSIAPTEVDILKAFEEVSTRYEEDFADVKGQENVKRGLEVAAAGGHNIIMVGPPGSGKTMLAQRLPTIIPPPTLQEALETTKIHSVAGKIDKNGGLIARRPFRAPHHTISNIGLVGGGTHPQPGEISLAHNGVLFLDELPEFQRAVLEVLRQPLEDRHITVSRARYSIDYPANCMLVASLNPCPCGNHGHPDKPCFCNPNTIARYLSRVSGPLLDRIDIHIEVVPVPFAQLADMRPAEPSAAIRARVTAARKVQEQRFAHEDSIHCNAMMPARLLKKHCRLSAECSALLKTAVERIGLSARAYNRILKVARTIADLEGAADIQPEHVSEAIQYRSLDREGWAG